MYIEAEKGLREAIDQAAREFAEQAYLKPTTEESHLTFNAMNRALQVVLRYQSAQSKLTDKKDRGSHPLLTAAEAELIDKLTESENPDLLRLLEAVRRLSKLKMHEGAFPLYAAVIDHIRCSAFAAMLVEKLPVGRSQLTWEGGKTPTEHCQLLSTTLKCPTTDLVLVARPCLRIPDSMSRDTRERLADLGRLCVTVQNLPVCSSTNNKMFHTPIERSEIAHHIWQGSLADFLADENGYGIQRQPATLSRDPRNPIEGLFGTGKLDEYQQAYPDDFGVFLASGTVVSIDINYPILKDETVVIDTGLVMARYTTKKDPLDSHETVES